MADDVNPTLRTELEAATGVLVPQIAGLHDMAVAGTSITGELRDTLLSTVQQREQRLDLIAAAIASLDAANAAMEALEEDGYPELPPVTIPGSQYADLQEQLADQKAAGDVFQSGQASAVSVNLGKPVPKDT
jgi:predicted dinucleotide-utilizing enzyme